MEIVPGIGICEQLVALKSFALATDVGAKGRGLTDLLRVIEEMRGLTKEVVTPCTKSCPTGRGLTDLLRVTEAILRGLTDLGLLRVLS